MAVGRRGFLGVLAAAPVAGPAAIKEAAGQMALSQSHPVPSYGGLIGATEASCQRLMMEPDDAVRKAFRLGIVSRDQLLEFINGTKLSGGDGMGLYCLDPDLQAAKSFSTATRFRIQRERNRDREIERFLAKPRSMWEFGRELIEKGLVKEDRP